MKTRARITLLVAAAMTVTLLFSCSLAPVSIKDRINDFFDSLNTSDRSDTHKNLDPDTAAYSTADNTFWEGAFPVGERPFSYSGLDTSDESNVTMNISNNSISLGPYHFVMVDIGSPAENWVINDIRQPTNAPADSIF